MQVHHVHSRLCQVQLRPNHRPVREGDLEREALPCPCQLPVGPPQIGLSSFLGHCCNHCATLRSAAAMSNLSAAWRQGHRDPVND